MLYMLYMKNLRVKATAFPDNGYEEYGAAGMPRIDPRNMSRVMIKAVQKETRKKVQNTVRPGGVCYTDLKNENSAPDH